METPTQTDSLSRKIAGRIGAECVHPFDTFAMGAAAEVISSELAKREKKVAALITATQELLGRFIAVCPDADNKTDPADKKRIAKVRAALSGLGVK